MANTRPVAVLFGTRPEAIKLSPVILELRRRKLPNVVIVTGQHRDLVQPVLTLFGIEPDEDLLLMREEQSLDYLLSSVLSGVGSVLERHLPSAVLIQGDTTSALGAALAAFHHSVPIGHVEAGLRSHDMSRPFPEEMNRRVISVVARWHFAPTPGAAANLAAEGVIDGVTVTGNTVVDALRFITSRPHVLPDDLAAFIGKSPLILATAHRRESWTAGIPRIAGALLEVLRVLPDHRLVFATHPNPIVRQPVERMFADEPRARVITAIEYPQFLALLARSQLAISDSGGVQEEGPTLGVPVLVTRDVTERPEGVAAGGVELIGTDFDRVRTASLRILTDPAVRSRMAKAGPEVYGDGHASRRIVDVLAHSLGTAEATADRAQASLSDRP